MDHFLLNTTAEDYLKYAFSPWFASIARETNADFGLICSGFASPNAGMLTTRGEEDVMDISESMETQATVIAPLPLPQAADQLAEASPPHSYVTPLHFTLYQIVNNPHSASPANSPSAEDAEDVFADDIMDFADTPSAFSNPQTPLSEADTPADDVDLAEGEVEGEPTDADANANVEPLPATDAFDFTPAATPEFLPYDYNHDMYVPSLPPLVPSILVSRY